MKYIELMDISKSYDGRSKVIDKINLEVEQGEFFVLVGASGCGKSTLLRIIAGLEDITEGILKINNVIVNEVAPKGRNISFVFQNYALYPHMTVKNNILFGLDLKRITKEEQNKRLKEVAEAIGLVELLDRKPGQLSGGQRQRVALARSICSQAAICLMDEPLSNLDAKLRAQMRAEIRRIHKKFKLTTIYVTHDQIEAMTMGDRIMVLNGGRIQQIGTPLELYNNPSNKFVASFIGSPQMNIVNVSVENDVILIDQNVIGRVNSKLKDIVKNGESYCLGIRPENIFNVQEESDMSQSVVVDGIELLGNETQLTFKLGETSFITRWPGQWEIKIGDVVKVEFNVEKFHFFDLKTEKLLNLLDVNNPDIFTLEV